MEKCKEVARIINKYLDSSNLKEISHVNECDIDSASFSEDSNYIQWNSKFVGEFKHQYISNNKLDSLFDDTIKKDRKYDYGQFYHFKPFNRAYNIIHDGKIQLTTLSKQKDLDEYSEFLKQYCYNPLLDDKHIEDAKNDIYIFCFTKHFRNDRFWEEYAEGHTGICLVFRFTNFKELLNPLYCLLDVAYDNENIFDFINHIQDEIFDKFGKHIFIGADRSFACHFKRAHYSWESEIRMIFDFHENEKLLNSQFGVNGINLNNYIKKEIDNKTNRRYIRLPFKNPFFELKIDEIICGKEVTDKKIKEIKSIAPDTNHIWRMH